MIEEIIGVIELSSFIWISIFYISFSGVLIQFMRKDWEKFLFPSIILFLLTLEIINNTFRYILNQSLLTSVMEFSLELMLFTGMIFFFYEGRKTIRVRYMVMGLIFAAGIIIFDEVNRTYFIKIIHSLFRIIFSLVVALILTDYSIGKRKLCFFRERKR